MSNEELATLLIQLQTKVESLEKTVERLAANADRTAWFRDVLLDLKKDYAKILEDQVAEKEKFKAYQKDVLRMTEEYKRVIGQQAETLLILGRELKKSRR